MHTIQCKSKAFDHSDAAKRASDNYNLHRVTNPYDSIGKWIAVALSDGSSDGVLYDTKKECVSHQHHDEMWYAYIRINPSSMMPCDAEIFLRMHRMMYDKGIRLADPDDVKGGRDVIKRSTSEDQFSLLRSIRSGGTIRPSNLLLPGDDF
jgi:hypothetical protein